MSIALKYIKERRFIKKTEGKVNLHSGESERESESEKLPSQTSQIVYTGTFNKEPPQISNNGKNTFISERNEKVSQTANQTLKFWEMVFNDAPTLKEYELINILLKLENLEENPSNNTKMLNKIFKAEYNGYIKQTSSYSHIWELVV